MRMDPFAPTYQTTNYSTQQQYTSQPSSSQQYNKQQNIQQNISYNTQPYSQKQQTHSYLNTQTSYTQQQSSSYNISNLDNDPRQQNSSNYENCLQVNYPNYGVSYTQQQPSNSVHTHQQHTHTQQQQPSNIAHTQYTHTQQQQQQANITHTQPLSHIQQANYMNVRTQFPHTQQTHTQQQQYINNTQQQTHTQQQQQYINNTQQQQINNTQQNINNTQQQTNTQQQINNTQQNINNTQQNNILQNTQQYINNTQQNNIQQNNTQQNNIQQNNIQQNNTQQNNIQQNNIQQNNIQQNNTQQNTTQQYINNTQQYINNTQQNNTQQNNTQQYINNTQQNINNTQQNNTQQYINNTQQYINNTQQNNIQQNTQNDDYTPPFVKTFGKKSTSNIDSMQIPRPIFGGDVYTSSHIKTLESDKYISPPSSHIPFKFIDKGSASVRFMRMTLASCPGLTGSQYSTNIPFASIIQPFADLGPYEQDIPLVDLTNGISLNNNNNNNNNNITNSDEENGPIRCMRCRSYINPFMVWDATKHQCVCNLCQYSFKVPSFYLPSRGVRPELSVGSVDFVASKSYSSGISKPPIFCFLIENTQAARYTNMTNCVLTALQRTISHITSPLTEITIITFDDTLQFYSLDTSKETPQWNLLVVSDINDPFIPAPDDSLCINVEENRDALNDLIKSMSSYFTPTPSSHSAANAALLAAVSLLSNRGCGIISLFCVTMPDSGIGALKLETKLKDKAVPELQNANYYENILKICYSKGISIDLHCFPIKNTQLNLHTLSYPSIQTGGKTHFLKDFQWDRDYEKIYYDIVRMIERPTGFDCSFKLRTSKGLSVTKLITSFNSIYTQNDNTSFKIPRLDADSAFSFELKLDEDLSEVQTVYLQAACLYTNLMGIKLIRVHTVALNVSTNLHNLFRNADLDALISVITRMAVLETYKGKTTWKETLNTLIIEILFSYRYNVASHPTPDQLFLPEALKFLPIFFSAMLKHIAFRSQTTLTDEQIWYLNTFLSNPVKYTISTLYPKIYPIHRSYSKRKSEQYGLSKIGKPTEIPGFLYIPENIPAKGEFITTDGVYIFDLGTYIILYIGDDVNPEYLSSLFGGEAASYTLPTSEWKLTDDIETSQGAMINQLIRQIQFDRKSFTHPHLRMILPRSNEESSLYPFFVEDAFSTFQSYVDMLSQLHQSVLLRIQNY